MNDLMDLSALVGSLPKGDGLVLSFCFPPFADTAGVVAAKRVYEFGRPVRVISNNMSRIRRRDASLDAICGSLVREAVVLDTPTAFSSWHSIEAYTVRAREISREWIASGRCSWMYSRSQFTASNIAAAAVKTVEPSFFWVAEFSDPLSRDVEGSVRKGPVLEDSELAKELRDFCRREGLVLEDPGNSYELAETVTLALADRVIFTNEIQRDYMLGYCADRRLAEVASRKAIVAPHPTPRRELFELVESDVEIDNYRTTIGYFGNFYANRGIGDLLRGFSPLSQADRNRLVLRLFTSRVDDVNRMANAQGVLDCVRAEEPLPYLEFLNTTDKMDFLFVNDVDGRYWSGGRRAPFLPSKLADYRGSRSRIWAATSAGSPLDQVQTDLKTPVGNVSAFAHALCLIARDEV